LIQERGLSLIPIQNEIEKVNNQIRSVQFPRIMAFADVVTRYTEIVFKTNDDQISLLSSSALLFIITRGGSLTLSQLAAVMLRPNYSITKLIDSLERDNYVKRCRKKMDGRSFEVKVTERGLNYIIQRLKISDFAEADLKSWLNENELKELSGIIRKLRDKLIEKTSETRKLTIEDKTAIFGKSNHQKQT
jgi:DNA-binding MarR family transcriptional regulator